MTRLRLNTVIRVGVRTLIVAGFAGGVWLLSSAAAHAAAPAATTDQTGPVVNLTAPAAHLLDQVLAPAPDHATRSAAAPPTEAAPVGHPTRPGADLRNAAESTGPTVLSKLVSSVFDAVRPLRAADRIGTTITNLLPLTGPRLAPALAGWRHVPVFRAGAPAAAPSVAVVGPAPVTVDGAHRNSTRIRPQVGSVVRTAPAVNRPAVTGPHQLPGLPDRAPVPAYPDSGSTGISPTPSGSQHDAGGYAVVPAPVVAGQPAGAQWLRAFQVAVSPLLAQAPIFAPD
jgi:hypothetical protein